MLPKVHAKYKSSYDVILWKLSNMVINYCTNNNQITGYLYIFFIELILSDLSYDQSL